MADLELSREEGIENILTLIDLIPDPAIIYHRIKDEILIANNALFLLTNLGEIDFIGQPIKSLIPNIIDTDPISGHDKKVLLRHKKQPLIRVTIHIYTLSQSSEYLLMILKPDENEVAALHNLSEQIELIEMLTSLMQTDFNGEITEILQEILAKSAGLLNADLVCLYKASGTIPKLIKYLSNDAELASELPDQLINADLNNAAYPLLWSSITPAATPLQQAAADANYRFLAISPLGGDTGKFGLFVAGGKEHAPHPNVSALASLIAAYLTRVMESQTGLHNLRNLSHKIKQVVKIQSEIITNLDEGVIILSPDLSVADINPAAETILGYANVEALRQQIDTILIGSDSLRSAFNSAQQGIPYLTSGGLTLHHRNGNSFPAQLMMVPVMSTGHLLAVFVLIRDLSQEEQSQAVRKQLEQRAILGEVTAIFAHEVRNPINAIMLSLQVVEDNLPEGDENLTWIENMRDECNKLMYLMDSVLSFAKPLEYKMSGVDLDFLLTRIIERWHPRFIRLNISCYYETNVTNPIVEGDMRALEQVFTNLISNAVNAMSDGGGSLGITISQPKDQEDQNYYQVTLTDSGHGIPDEIKAHLFKPFVTGSNYGTGLGLAITQRIINAHKGRIEVDSFAGGTIFKIFLSKHKGFSNL